MSNFVLTDIIFIYYPETGIAKIDDGYTHETITEFNLREEADKLLRQEKCESTTWLFLMAKVMNGKVFEPYKGVETPKDGKDGQS